MIKIKLEKNKRDNFLVKLKLDEEVIDKYKILKRVIFESRRLKGEYNYAIPEKFLSIILKSIPKDIIALDEESIFNYLEFSDDYDEKYYYALEASARYMKKWREEGCPTIYKVSINRETASISKEIAFQRINKNIK